ncbi:hypothetical protein ACIPUC_12520 [Streptomyces sp. LARHCF249]
MTETEIDPVRRLHVMAAGVRGARVAEHVVPAPFEEVWPAMAELDFLPDLHRIRVRAVDGDGDRVEATARSAYGFRARLRGFRRPGWCWLQSRFLIVGVAAAPTPDGTGTRIALTGGVRVPTRAAVVPFGTLRELTTAAHRLETRVCGPAPRPGGRRG